MSGFAKVTWLLWPLIIAKVLNLIQEQGVTSSNLWTIFWWFFALIVLNAIGWALHGPSRVLERENAFLMRTNYKIFLLDGVLNLSSEWHTDHHSGDTIDKIEKSTRALYEFASNSFEVIGSIVSLIVSYGILVYFNIHAGYIVLILLVLTIILILEFDKRLVIQYNQLNKIDNSISAKIFDSISNISTIIILRVEKLVSGAIYRKIISPFKIFKSNITINEVKWFLVSMAVSVMIVAVLFSYIVVQYLAGVTILIGTLYALYGYLDRIESLFYTFAWKYNEMVQQKASVMNGEELVKDFVDRSKVKKLKMTDWKILSIRSLNFSYHTEEGKDLHLNDISMIINRGERIALIGESGSGKTTFLKIIRDLYPIKSGKIFLDGHLLKGGFKKISNDISLIPQDPEIFATTIKENITLGVNHKMGHIRKFTDMAEFTSVAESLPKKFNSSIVEKGVNLSGGQKQRLALTRGLMASEDKEIILLDESTSSVDTKNELSIYLNIFRDFKEKTVIASIHKLHLLSLFDTIYYFESGKIIASGNLSELLKVSKKFRFMWNKYNKARNKE